MTLRERLALGEPGSWHDDAEGWTPARARRRWRVGASPWLCFLAVPLSAGFRHGVAAGLLGVALLAGFVFVYLWRVPGALRREGSTTSFLTVAAMLGLGLADCAVAGDQGLATLVFTAVGAAVLLGRFAPGAVLAIAALGVLAPLAVPGWHAGAQWSLGLSIVLAAVVTGSMMRLIRANVELREAREQVAALAAEKERLRIARDLHDLLGHSLTTVTVKAGLARRLTSKDPVRAAREMGEVEQIARESLADVRAAIAGYRDVRLTTELAAAREVLAAAGIAADLPAAVDEVPDRLRELFGWAVREAVTNVVRHSRASRVVVRVDPRSVEVIDDGPVVEGHVVEGRVVEGRVGERHVGAGSGLRGLSERAAEAGGRVEAGPRAGGGFRLRVEVPA